ncbi:42346_t:CDS:10 [Gigaspora margarita]|uniref:ubiquitinyl hydrolase 1 n=1 Tax=Gigaspora margarita TaxID=4874 RepID=A0ABN7UG86_GIGMA|nr:42346_t:CDS:10 [Gigaspora margarita]
MSRLVVTDYENFANRKMQHLDYEVEDFQFYTWNITGWRNLEGEVASPEFVAGGWRWRILLYPLGDNDNDVVSIYLEFADRYIAPNGWHSCAQFAFTLWNPEEPTEFVYSGGHQRFTTESSNWGYTRFCEHRKLFVPLENQTHSLIENDSCNITAFVRIIKDPTGFLWHNFKNYNSKKETGYITLKNEGTTGYLNATLQLLFSLTNFRKAVYQIPTENDIQDKCVPLAIQNIFYQMQTSDSPVGTKELMKSFGWDSLNSFMQHDAHEFNNALRNNLENKMEGCKTLDDSFMDYIKEETLKGNNKYHTENYGLQDATKRVIFESFPSILQLQLKRFEYDVQNATANKINDRHEFPMEIDLQKYLSPEADRSKPYKYLLYGVIPVTDKEVFESSYGGDGKFSSAYVLVYIRESDIDNILYPMLPEDIPEHLQRRLDKEKIKEAEEQKLYLCYGIANFNNPQYPLSEVLQFKVLKTETYSAFKDKLATNFKIPTEQIRFWALFTNNSIRLIADNYLSLSMSRICTGMGLEQNEMKLYLEISHKPINDEQNKIDSIFPILCDKKEFPPHTPLRIYNEANFVLIEELSHLKNGDIICFQKDLAEINKIGRVHDIPSFYKSLSARIIVQFKPKFKDGRQQPEFELALDKEYTYDINVINILLPKNSIIDDVFREILLNMSLPELTNRVRLFEVTNCKNLKEYKSNDPIDNIQEDATLYAEEITQDEVERDINDKVVQVYHFTKRPSCTHGIPFKFVIKAGEIFSLTKLRLQARLGMNEKDFAEVKIAIVQEKPCIKTKYIIYDNVILSDHNLSSDKYLGLDYVCKTERLGIVGDDRKAVYIKE